MSNYIFKPPPSFGTGEEPFVTWDNGFSPEELDLIDKIASLRTPEDGTIYKGGVDEGVRTSKVTWIEHNQDSAWLYDRLAYILTRLNGQFFKYDMFGFNEHLQYTVYEGDTEGHYTWHLDTGNDDSPRKLSLVLQLSEPEDYEGGDLELLVGPDPLKVDKKRGLIAVFPSFRLHRVTPVTKGKRKTLVVWACGPAFK